MGTVARASIGCEPDQASATDLGLLALAPVCILVCRPDGTISAFNEACETFSRLRASEVVGESLVNVLDRLDILDASALRLFWHRYLAGGSSSAAVEVRCIGPNDDRRTLRCSLRTVPDVGGAPRSIIVVGHDISADRAAARRLRERADTDALTGLATRSALESALDSATLGERGGGHVLFVDLDDFKSVNDEFGHATGDLVLTEVAARLRGTVRRGDIVSRIGGDEFVVFCRDTDAAAVTDLVARLRRAIGHPIPAGPDVIEIPASIGAAPVAAGIDWRESLALADRDMYADKASESIRLPRRDARRRERRAARR